MPAPAPMPRAGAAVGRRTLLRGAVAAATAGLSGCGIRLEDDAPTVPLIPRRSPLVVEDQLLALLANSRELAAACGAWTTGDGPRLGPELQAVHQSQAEVLAAILAGAKVPAARLASATLSPSGAPATRPSAGSGTGTTTATTSPPAPVASADIAALERRPLADLFVLSGCAGALRPTVAAVLAQRYAAARLIGGIAPALPLEGATGASGPTATSTSTGPPSTATTSAAWPSQPDLLAVLAATRSAVYGFQVVAAQGDKPGRALGLSTLSELAELAADQTSRLTAEPPPAVIGYDLPFAVSSAALARKLAVTVATGLRAAYGAGLSVTGTDSGVFVDLVEWIGRADALTQLWGGPAVAFPGMTLS